MQHARNNYSQKNKTWLTYAVTWFESYMKVFNQTQKTTLEVNKICFDNFCVILWLYLSQNIGLQYISSHIVH